MGIIATLSAIAIIGGGLIGLGIVVCAVWMAIRWHREDLEAAQKEAQAAAAA